MTQQQEQPNTSYLTRDQIAALCKMMFYAFVEIRMHARNGHSERVRMLADIFHNIPLLLFQPNFDVSLYRQSLVDYRDAFGDFIGYLDVFKSVFGEVSDNNAASKTFNLQKRRMSADQ